MDKSMEELNVNDINHTDDMFMICFRHYTPHEKKTTKK